MKSLEDKAKEIEFYGNFEKDLDRSLDHYLLGEIDTEELIKRIYSFTRKQILLARKQALKDMMERAKEKSGYSDECWVSIDISDLEKIAEDLIKESR